MKAGEVVDIYFDPLTKENSEGKARLIKKSECDPGRSDMEFWEVKFHGDTCISERWITIN